jgi:tRNA (guanine-N7-)-methyltransferase
VKLRAKTKKRLRHHTNPLTFRAEELVPPDWDAVLGGPPQDIDIGIGLGDFLCAYAQLHPQRRIAGLEVRKAFCEEAQLRLTKTDTTNAVVVHVDATRFLSQVIPPQSTERVFVSFPDPWFKKRHHKRRLFEGNFLEQIHAILVEEGEFLVQSDNKDLVDYMIEAIEVSGLFHNIKAPYATVDEPFSEATTEREDYYAKRNLPVWRFRYIKHASKQERDSS